MRKVRGEMGKASQRRCRSTFHTTHTMTDEKARQGQGTTKVGTCSAHQPLVLTSHCLHSDQSTAHTLTPGEWEKHGARRSVAINQCDS